MTAANSICRWHPKPCLSKYITVIAAEAVFGVVVQDEIQLLWCEPVVPCQHRVDSVENGLLGRQRFSLPTDDARQCAQ